MDLSPLRNEVTFGLNRVYLMFEKLGFPTSYLVSVNRYVIEQCADDLLDAEPAAVPGLPFPAVRPRTAHVPCSFDRLTRPGFSTDPSRRACGRGRR